MADDVSQEVFIKVHKSIQSFKEQSSLKTWVFRIAANTALTEIKKHTRNTGEDYPEHLQDHNENIEQTLIDTSFKQAVETTLEYLSPVQRMVFTLRHIHGKTTKEASDIMDCSEGHIKKQLFLAIKRIRNVLEQKYPDHVWS